MTLIDSVLTMPGTVVEEEYKCRIAAINAVIAVCDADEGAPSRPRTLQKRSADAVDMPPAASHAEEAEGNSFRKRLYFFSSDRFCLC